MTNLSVDLVADLIEAAMASYGDFPQNQNVTSDDLKQLLVAEADFSETQADEFIERYDFKNHLPNQASGFSATVFWDKIDQKYVLAIRGTDFSASGIPSDIISTDVLGIGGRGFAVDQAIDLYRYFRQLTTPVGQEVEYSAAELWHLFMLKSSVQEMPIIGPVVAASFILWQETFGGDEGLGVMSAGESVTAVGHSLGGHLAMLFGRFFPNNTDSVVVHNAPDFYPHGLATLLAAGFPVPPGYDDKIIQLDGEGDRITHFGTVVPGDPVDFTQEVEGWLRNHSSVNGVDAFNLMSLMATIDPTLSQQISGGLSTFIRNASHLPINTYESLLDNLRLLFLGAGIAPTAIAADFSGEAREDLYQNLHALRDMFEPGGVHADLVAGRNMRHFCRAGA